MANLLAPDPLWRGTYELYQGDPLIGEKASSLWRSNTCDGDDVDTAPSPLSTLKYVTNGGSAAQVDMQSNDRILLDIITLSPVITVGRRFRAPGA